MALGTFNSLLRCSVVHVWNMGMIENYNQSDHLMRESQIGPGVCIHSAVLVYRDVIAPCLMPH